MKLKWIEIDPENLPQGEVLARDDNWNATIGLLEESEKRGFVDCINVEQDLHNCTHYAALELPTPDEAFATASVLAAKYEESLGERMAYLKGFIHGLSWLKSKIE